MYKFTPVLPEVLRSVEGIDRLRGNLIGNDLEWNQSERPTILGLSDGETTVSVPFSAGLDHFKELVARPDVEWVGHNIVAADLIVLERLGIKLPLDRIQDTIIWMWLVNMHLAKAGGKTALEEDEGEKRGRGFYNLGTMLSVYTDIWHYKDCRGSGCAGPCPEHDKYGYNGIDALGPVLALHPLRRQAQLRGVDKLYPMHRELAYVLARMQEGGVRIDVPYVYGRGRHPLGSVDGNSLDEQFRREKDEIAAKLPFNPRSPKAVTQFFKALGLEDAQEQTVRELIEDLGDQAPVELVQLLEYKELGNGCDRWYEPQYRDKDGWLRGYLDEEGFVHPRLNFFTSSARLACSSPNFQNVYKRKGELIRKAIIAPAGWYICRADYCLPKGTRILTSDFQWKPIETIQKGDELFAFDENIGTYNTKTCLSKVEDTSTNTLPCYRVRTTKGSMIASEGHLWVCRRYLKGRWKKYTWIKTEDLRVGDTLGWFTTPWETDESRDAGYIAGFLDGEGYLKGYHKRQPCGLEFAQNRGPVFDHVIKILRNKGFGLTEYQKTVKLMAAFFTGEDRPAMRALGVFRPLRLLKKAKEAWIGKRVWNSHTGKAVILSIDRVGSQEVIGLTTSSGTLISEGFLTHNSNAENRFVLHMGGYTIPRELDLHTWVGEMAGLTKDMELVKRTGGGKIRQAAKSIQHANNILEGLQLKLPADLRRPKIQAEIKAGARVVYPNWTFKGKVVSFTGVNLARRTYGDASWEHRKDALEISARYFDRFPGVRKFQQRVSRQCEVEGAVRTPLGYCLLSFGDDEERMKIAQGVWQQQPIAHLTKLALLRLWKRWERDQLMRPVLQVHDEILCYVKGSVSPTQAMAWIQEDMEIEMPEIPGLVIPADPTWGPTWAESDQKSS